MNTPQPKKPLQQLEILCLMIAAAPGLLLVTSGRVQNHTQAVFRLSVFVVGLVGFIAIKIYQCFKSEKK